MKTILIDGKEYVERESMEADNQGLKIVESHLLMDSCNVIGMGSVKLEGSITQVKIQVEFLLAALESIRAMKCLNKAEWNKQAIDLLVGQQFPLMVGELTKGRFAGVIIAPRYTDEEDTQ